LAVVPAAIRQDKLADLCHVAWPQAKSPSGVGIPLDPIPLHSGDAQGLEQIHARKFVEGCPVALRIMADTSVSAPVL
jgi:hypothetical protein